MLILSYNFKFLINRISHIIQILPTNIRYIPKYVHISSKFLTIFNWCIFTHINPIVGNVERNKTQNPETFGRFGILNIIRCGGYFITTFLPLRM